MLYETGDDGSALAALAPMRKGASTPWKCTDGRQRGGGALALRAFSVSRFKAYFAHS